MSPVQHSLLSQQPHHSYVPTDPVQTLHPPPNDTGRVIFTRQLWQRNMPDGKQGEQVVLNKSQTANSRASHNNASGSRRTSTTISLRSQRRSPSPSRGSKTPLTPEESPPFKTTRKRRAAVLEQEDKATEDSDVSPSHTRASSGDSAIHVCICQPDPKIPRPRNAFILYRQHHQAQVVARNRGLANPEISKIIGEQWQNEELEEKNRWKALAEAEKIRHQQQFPGYRYQPKRNTRRNSTDDPGSAEESKCQKCGGRTILTPSALYIPRQSRSVPPTPGSSSATPLSRTLPVLRDLSLEESPAARRGSGRSYTSNNMSPNHRAHMEERDAVGPLSPDSKRRRYNGDPPPPLHRAMPPRYGGPPQGAPVGPGTPFPFGQPLPPHPYPPASTHARRESLPGIRGVVSPPGPMGPPPRPGMGYQQHRLSQGHVPQDHPLTLPPLQTGSAPSTGATAGSGKTTDEQIMNISFRYKIKVLSQVAPPAARKKDAPRGPLIAVEGDSPDAVKELSAWLRDTLSKDADMAVTLLDGPEITTSGDKEEVMAQYHRLAAEWLEKNKSILESVAMKPPVEKQGNERMINATPARTPSHSARNIDDDYGDSSGDDSSPSKGGDTEMREDAKPSEPQRERRNSTNPASADKMDVDRDKRSSTASSTLSSDLTTAAKPVTLVPNYSLHASNLFARMIPIGSNDPYAPSDHWQWTATLWRGIIGPDLTVYVRDAMAGTTGPSVEIEPVEGRTDAGLFVVKRVKGESADAGGNGGDGFEVEASVLRRVAFEVSEWVRAFVAGRHGKN